MITFDVNNGGILSISQAKHDEPVSVRIIGSDTEYTISAGDMVMLLNYYRYVKGNDIQSDFINPTGRNKD